jgi:cation/acetate symporter
MIHEASPLALGVFAIFVAFVLGISFYLGSKAKSASGYYAAHGEIPWFVNGVAFAGDYLSAASFLGICGMIAFYGYDGFLYSIGYLAGWIVALLVVAEPLKRLGKFTFADALDSQFHSPGIRLTAAISTLVVSIFYLIPQMVGAGALIRPLLGLESLGLEPYHGVIMVGVIVTLIVVTAGMVSTTWVQFIKGAMLVMFCTLLTGMILQRGLTTHPKTENSNFVPFEQISLAEYLKTHSELEVVPPSEKWVERAYVRLRDKNSQLVTTWRKMSADNDVIARAQTLSTKAGVKQKIVNGLPQGKKEGETDFFPVGQIIQLPDGYWTSETDPEVQTSKSLNPLSYFSWIQGSKIVVWSEDKPAIPEENGYSTRVFYPKIAMGNELLTPGGSPTFAGIRKDDIYAKLDFLSLMLALFAGTASLPHILIRYYTVKDQDAARKSTVVGIATIGFFYILTLYLGLGAMTSGVLDPTDSNMAAPLLAKSFGALPFAIISAIAFTTVLGTVSGLILAASGAVAHDLATGLFKLQLNDHEKVRVGKIAAVIVGIIGIVLGIIFENFNVTFLVGWAFNVAASANLPSLVMLLFWKRTTKHGITASIFVGLFSSLTWVLCSGEAYDKIYGWNKADSFLPFNQPALVTLPLAFIVLIVVSLFTPPPASKKQS